ncbi:MAG TPA: DUF4231 domain-containing protein [Streptosporangiaceae bacterium]|nr:DUF4231 domain-containing protein [Streptosporangiaceae bacterium]
MPPGERDAFPDLAADFAFLDQELMPAFTELDELAQREQNRYWRQQVSLVAGALLITLFGTVQAGLRDQVWPGVVVGLLAAAMGAVTATARQQDVQGAYLKARIKAERLRGLYFTYLAGLEPYGDPRSRRKALISGVAAIKRGEEPR